MRFAVVGPGATGTLFGARLAGAGHSVVLVGRPTGSRTIEPVTITVEGVRPGTFPAGVAGRIPPSEELDAVLLCVKAFSLPEAAREVARLDPPRPLLASQNGLGIDILLDRALRAGGWADPGPYLVRAIHSVPATFLGAYRVRQAGDGEFVFPAEGGAAAGASRRWAEWIREAGYPVRRAGEFSREVWKKAIVNAAVNPVTALHDVLNGRLRESPWREEALELLEEARRVAAAEGVAIDRGEAEAALWRVVDATSSNRSSMLQDLSRGRPTEIGAITGEIVSRATRHGIPVPASARALAAVKRATAGAPRR